MKILFCSFYADGLHGSPLHILEYGCYLNSIGHDVSYIGLFISEQIKKIFNKNNIRVYSLQDIPSKQSFDIVWAFHIFLLPYLLNHGIKCKKVISVSLSPFLLLERLSFYHNYMSLLTVISHESYVVHKERYGINSHIIPNHIPDNFLSIRKEKYSDSPSRIAVISNHPPQELLDISHPQLSVVYYGSSVNNSRMITPEVLLNYDVVISIGKTVFYCMGVGVPVFEYDRFGGCGFITPDNLSGEEATNFSGRTTRRKLSSKEITKEIFDTYDATVENIQKLRDIASKKYRLSDLVQLQLSLIEKAPEFFLPDTPEFKLFNDNCEAALEIFQQLGKQITIMSAELEAQQSLSSHILKFINENLPYISGPVSFCFNIIYKIYTKILKRKT